MSKFSTKTVGSKTTNRAGGVAYSHSPEMELAVAVLSTFLKDTYYETGDSRLDRIKTLCGQVETKFLANLAITAREDFYLRSVSHVLVGELAKRHRGDSLVMKTVERVVQRPDDMTELVGYLGKPLPKQVKRGLRHAILKFSPYQLFKYRMEGKTVSLVDVFNLVHPNPKHATEEQAAAWKALIKGELKSQDTWESRLSSGEDKATVWKGLIMEDKIGYMALLRNLRNVGEQADEATQARACEVIADEKRVEKSKQLPFRFFNAYNNIPTSNSSMLNAVAQAMEYSLKNVPIFDGKTLVAVDCSGSMSGDPMMKAAVFAAALSRNEGDVILFDDQVKEMRMLSGNPILTTVSIMLNAATGGGTNTSLVFSYAIQTKKKYDRIVIISDNESWQDTRWYGQPTNDVYNHYKSLGHDPYIYAIDIQGHGTKDVAGGKVFHLAGWSDKLFDFMKWIEKENELIDFINAKGDELS